MLRRFDCILSLATPSPFSLPSPAFINRDCKKGGGLRRRGAHLEGDRKRKKVDFFAQTLTEKATISGKGSWRAIFAVRLAWSACLLLPPLSVLSSTTTQPVRLGPEEAEKNTITLSKLERRRSGKEGG